MVYELDSAKASKADPLRHILDSIRRTPGPYTEEGFGEGNEADAAFEGFNEFRVL